MFLITYILFIKLMRWLLFVKVSNVFLSFVFICFLRNVQLYTKTILCMMYSFAKACVVTQIKSCKIWFMYLSYIRWLSYCDIANSSVLRAFSQCDTKDNVSITLLYLDLSGVPLMQKYNKIQFRMFLIQSNVSLSSGILCQNTMNKSMKW